MKVVFGAVCVYCGADERRPAMEHVVPLCRGGAHAVHNVVPSCRACNGRKGRMPPDQFLAKLPRDVGISAAHRLMAGRQRLGLQVVPAWAGDVAWWPEARDYHRRPVLEVVVSS